MKIGLIVNPVAGLGGAVGLKGTDGPDIVAEALRRGAVAHSGERARRAMARLVDRVPGTEIVTVSGEMGAAWLNGLALTLDIRGLPEVSATATDTRQAVCLMADCDLIAFAGGDGTARDVAGCLPTGAALLGIPCGVKMHSGVFAISPEAAGAVLADIVAAPDRMSWDETAEIMDIDEEALRAGRLAPKLYSHAKTPVARNRVQASKGGPRRDWSDALRGAAAEIVEQMDPDTLYIVGPGTSAGTVIRAAGFEPTVLGIDALKSGKLVARDAGADVLEALAKDGPVRIVLGVTGQQGFLLGRGNQQISPKVIKKSGRGGLIVIAAEDKLAALAQPRLWVETGEPKLDDDLAGFVRVRTGRGREMIMRIATS
ncbi:MAG: putative polyphosphate/ATP-dependent NAD kinase [Dinoroseobacter sp.]